jgi:hypothetical protein
VLRFPGPLGRPKVCQGPPLQVPSVLRVVQLHRCVRVDWWFCACSWCVSLVFWPRTGCASADPGLGDDVELVGEHVTLLVLNYTMGAVPVAGGSFAAHGVTLTSRVRRPVSSLRMALSDEVGRVGGDDGGLTFDGEGPERSPESPERLSAPQGGQMGAKRPFFFILTKWLQPH